MDKIIKRLNLLDKQHREKFKTPALDTVRKHAQELNERRQAELTQELDLQNMDLISSGGSTLSEANYTGSNSNAI